MTGNSDIDLSLSNIWQCWFDFRTGKRASIDIIEFEYYLERNLFSLQRDLATGSYSHGGYKRFVVHDNKRREIAVASVRDRVVHRIIYNYLVPIYDRTFIYDAWSCRKGKGHHAAINRAQLFMKSYENGWLWRTDITKFFDSVNQSVMKQLLRRKVDGGNALWLLDEVINSYNILVSQPTNQPTNKLCHFGIPIGNLTSQIMANIYFNEFDRFISHYLKLLAYMRYGDDFLCFTENKSQVEDIKKEGTEFLKKSLFLNTNLKLDCLRPVRKGVSYLGIEFWPTGHHLNERMRNRIRERLDQFNYASYEALVLAHEKSKRHKELQWELLTKTIKD